MKRGQRSQIINSLVLKNLLCSKLRTETRNASLVARLPLEHHLHGIAVFLGVSTVLLDFDISSTICAGAPESMKASFNVLSSNSVRFLPFFGNASRSSTSYSSSLLAGSFVLSFFLLKQSILTDPVLPQYQQSMAVPHKLVRFPFLLFNFIVCAIYALLRLVRASTSNPVARHVLSTYAMSQAATGDHLPLATR